MNLVFFDDPVIRENLLPFTFTRPVAEIRIGILTIREKWEQHFSTKGTFFTESYLSEKFPLIQAEENLLINGAVIPNQELLSEIGNLKPGFALAIGKTVLAANVSGEFFTKNPTNQELDFENLIQSDSKALVISKCWDIFSKNGEVITADFMIVTRGRKSRKLSPTNQLIGSPDNLFIEEGAKVECSILNTSEGVIYIGKNAEVMEGSLIRGPFALCENATVKMGSKIYGATTFGPDCKVGGEVNNSVIFGNSNKAHDGFLGNSVIGEWCNLGADTNTSNLKNNYSSVKIWNYASENFVDSGLQFCGLMMGDHTKCAINTMFNTGTVVGVNANIFGFGFPAKFVPSFSWDGASELATYSFEQACDVAIRVMERRGKQFTESDKNILKFIFNHSAKHRHWEKR